MKKLLNEIKSCTICAKQLPHGVNPVLQASPNSRITVIGQAPGRVVHESGIPWDDKSGERLREWMGIDTSIFYDADSIALIPMGFCYPGSGKSGDLPPRKECAPAWHQPLTTNMQQTKLILLIGAYAQSYYLKKLAKGTLTETVKSYQQYLPKFFPLPHPSPRNNIWLARNPWFEQDLLPELHEAIQRALD